VAAHTKLFVIIGVVVVVVSSDCRSCEYRCRRAACSNLHRAGRYCFKGGSSEYGTVAVIGVAVGGFRHWLGSCCHLLAIGIAVVVMAVVILANVGAIFSMGAAVYSCRCKRQMNKQTTQSTSFLLRWWSYGCHSIIWHHQGTILALQKIKSHF